AAFGNQPLPEEIPGIPIGNAVEHCQACHAGLRESWAQWNLGPRGTLGSEEPWDQRDLVFGDPVGWGFHGTGRSTADADLDPAVWSRPRCGNVPLGRF
ncbi:MAG: hypothetical protein AAF989_08170, partial [Planctomycetota bacterium]